MSDSPDLIPEKQPTIASDMSSDVLDQTQLRRIEAVHRGFLYQHLYAVGCLLRLATFEGRSVSVERDEDVEVALQNGSWYLQIKTRAKSLQRGDVAGALERFNEIRDAHNSGDRTGTAIFRIVTNVAPSVALREDLNADEWPADVQVMWPGGPSDVEGEYLPPAWQDLAAAIKWCKEAARAIPFAAVAPETLVWKLTARVHFAATGSDRDRLKHTFNVAELPALFEQIVEQLQEFPSVPDNYRPQVNEPNLDDQRRARIVAGLSGAGKTLWAAQVAQHCAAPTAYFDVADLPGTAIASSLARELAARFLGRRGGESGAALLPTSSGLEMLQALNHRIEISPKPIVVVDNAHRAEPRDLFDIIGACSCLRFVFLVQPWEGLAEVEALFAERAEWLSGWDINTVAEEFAQNACRIDPATAERWRIISGGMPLFVKNVAHLTASQCGGDASRFADEIETESHPSTTAQEIILGRIVNALSEYAKTALAVLSLSTAPLSREESNRIFGVLPLPSAPWGRVLRELTTCGALQVFADGRIKTHDAFRILGRALQTELPDGALLASQVALRDLLLESFEKGRDLTRFGIWLRLLPATGDYKTLVDLATDEFFHEAGDQADLKAVLEKTANSEELDDEGKFYTLDALALWDWQAGDGGETFSKHLIRMDELVKKGGLGARERAALAMKQMIAASTNSDTKGVEIAFRNAEAECHSDPMLMRILRYNYAHALFQLGQYPKAEQEAESLYLEYYDVLGLESEDVLFTNPPQIITALGGNLSDHKDNLKRLGDCLDLYARSRHECGLFSGLARLHSLKFFAMAGAYRSAVKAGQEAVDDFIAMGDPEGARQIIEGQLLPLISNFELNANMVPVSSQYAVVLAYCGEVEVARKEMRRLQPFVDSLPPNIQHDLQKQEKLIEAINLGLVKKPSPVRECLPTPEPKQPSKRKTIKVGRNDPCPCGSGKKSKKCCYR